MPDRSHVAILLCTYNSARYLAEQLDSYVAQTQSDWTLYVNDDGSTDETRALLGDFRGKNTSHGVHLYEGPRKGFAANFLDLTCREDIEASYFAYSDHDDIWHPDKLRRAVKWLENIPADMPALYLGRSELIDADGKPCGYSPLYKRQPSFANALVQNIASGNTMVFNQSARALLMAAGKGCLVPSHDWWTYQLVSGAGGRVYYDPTPSICYRQHQSNIVGAQAGFSDIFRRVGKMVEGQFRHWNELNTQNLLEVSYLFTPENKDILSLFIRARNAAFMPRLYGFYQSGIYRQTLAGNAGLYCAAILNRI